MRTDEILLKPYFAYLWSKKFLVLLSILTLMAITLGVAFVLPAQWRASCVIVLPPTMGPMTVGMASAGASPLSMLHGVARSQVVYQAVGKKTGIKPVDLKQKVLDYEEDPVFSQFTITAVASKPQRAKEIVQATYDSIDGIARGVPVSMAGMQAKELERALAEREAKVREAEGRLEAFQATVKNVPDQNNPLVSTDAQRNLNKAEFDLGTTERQLAAARATASKIATVDPSIPSGFPKRDTWRDKIVQAEYDLQLARTRFGPQAVEVQEKIRALEVAKSGFRAEMRRYLESVNSNVDVKIVELESQRVLLGWQIDYLRKLAKEAPKEALQYARLLRDVKTQQAIADSVRQQYEIASLGMEVAQIQWTVLQEPTAEGTAFNKRFSLIALLAFAASTIFVVGFMCVRFGTRPRPEVV